MNITPFHIDVDNSKIPKRGYQQKKQEYTAQGVHVQFDNGQERLIVDFTDIAFTSLFDMREHFERIGNVNVTYHNDEAVRCREQVL